jgi:rhamnose transport system permease protein
MTWRRLLPGAHEWVLLGIILALGAVAAWKEPGFVTWEAQLELAGHAGEVMLAALVMTLIVLSGGIDLSIGSAVALCAVVFGLSFEAGAPVWACAGAALATGAVAGAVNGAFVAGLRVHPLVVTLATLAAYRGLAEGISEGRPISGFPDGFQWIGTGSAWGVPVPVWVCGVAVVLAGVLTARGVMGFRVYAIGDSERAARYAGVPVDRAKLVLYTLSGVVAGVCAVLLVARRNTAKADMGAGLELEAITAVVLGGASINGGRGRVLGTVLGVVLIHEVREFVSWHWARDELILIVVGAILVGAVLLNNVAGGSKRSRGV